jgi:hypothetical protein
MTAILRSLPAALPVALPVALSAALAVAAAALPLAVPLPLRAESAAASAAAADRLADTLRIGEVMAIMRDEGLAYARSIEDDLFPGQGGAGWERTVGVIYDAATMEARFRAAFRDALAEDPATVAAALGFFGDDRGQHILSLELEARRALLDEAVEDAAKARAEDMAAAGDARMAALREFAAANDLVEANVQGALNANLAFYRGMVEAGGAFTEDLTEEQMLDDVAGQEADIRAETEAWLYPYLALAYAPLADADLVAYTDFSRTPAGRRLNAALFAAFDAVFVPISRELGLATGRQLAGQDI